MNKSRNTTRFAGLAGLFGLTLLAGCAAPLPYGTVYGDGYSGGGSYYGPAYDPGYYGYGGYAPYGGYGYGYGGGVVVQPSIVVPPAVIIRNHDRRNYRDYRPPRQNFDGGRPPPQAGRPFPGGRPPEARPPQARPPSVVRPMPEGGYGPRSRDRGTNSGP